MKGRREALTDELRRVHTDGGSGFPFGEEQVAFTVVSFDSCAFHALAFS